MLMMVMQNDDDDGDDDDDDLDVWMCGCVDAWKHDCLDVWPPITSTHIHSSTHLLSHLITTHKKEHINHRNTHSRAYTHMRMLYVVGCMRQQHVTWYMISDS